MLALAALGCGREAGWPPGALLAGRSAALRELASRLAPLEGTRAAREAQAFAEAIPECELVEARADAPSLPTLRAGLRCADPSGPLAALHRARGERDLVFAWPLEQGRAVGSAQLGPDGDLALSLELPGAAFEGARSLLRPSAEAPGPPVLGGAEALVHARLRSHGGIDLPALLATGSQADQLFALRSQIFGKAVLDGTWELALYPPGEGERVPRAVLAFGTRSRALAEAAAGQFLGEIESTWSVRREPFSLGDASGACLAELRLLPGLAPCYLATQRALVIGWNESSLRKALDGSAAALPAAGGLVAELSRFPLADARIAAAGARAASPALPWRRLVVEAHPEAGAAGARSGPELLWSSAQASGGGSPQGVSVGLRLSLATPAGT
jgi:hypothetical protein